MKKTKKCPKCGGKLILFSTSTKAGMIWTHFHSTLYAALDPKCRYTEQYKELK